MKLKDFNNELTVIDNLDYNDPHEGYWFYNTGCQYPLVCPKGTKVKFKSVYHNYSGLWIEVEYNGQLCYAYRSSFDGNVIIKSQTIIYRDIAALQEKEVHRLFDINGNEWVDDAEKEELTLRRKHSSSFYKYYVEISKLKPFEILTM